MDPAAALTAAQASTLCGQATCQAAAGDGWRVQRERAATRARGVGVQRVGGGAVRATMPCPGHPSSLHAHLLASLDTPVSDG